MKILATLLLVGPKFWAGPPRFWGICKSTPLPT